MLRRGTPATIVLIGCILAGFAIEVLTGAWNDPRVLTELGAITRWHILEEGDYWRLLSAVFLHGDGTARGTLLHLALNVFALFQLGSLYELMFGTRRFVLIFFVAGIAASIASVVFNDGSSVGASGAVFGILGAIISSVKSSPRFRHNPNANSIVKQCVFWMIANIVIGFTVPQIDNAAHIGGLVTGLLLGALLPHNVPPPPPAQIVMDVRPYDQ